MWHLAGTVIEVDAHDRGHRGRCKIASAVLLVIVALVGCVSSPTRASLSVEEAAQLQLPGSSELASGGHDQEQSPEGDIPAIAWRRFGVDVAWQDVAAYFDAELKARGWEEGGGSSGLTSTIENAVEAWHKGDRILRLGHLRGSAKPEAGSFLTFYEVALIGQGEQSD
jgi:hypothetical protein